MNVWLRILLTPRCWLRNYPTDKMLSRFINRTLDAGHKPKRVDEYTVMLDNNEIWVENYPYAYGYTYGKTHSSIPDRATVFRLYDAVTAADKAPQQ